MQNPTENGFQTPLLAPELERRSTDEVVVDIGEGREYNPAQLEVQVKPAIDCGGTDGPYGFLGLHALSLSLPSPIDPFRNHTPSITGLYEWVKLLVCLPIAAVRLVVFGLALAVGFAATKMALQGWQGKQNPMPRWRCRIMWITRFCARCILFSFGYQWIQRKGRPAPRETAPIVVSNHISYIDPIFYFYELFPTMVSSDSHDSIPFVGTIIRAMQVIYVDRFSASSRKFAVNEIKRKASSDQFPQVLLFPEGTTTNGRVLISFQLGAFIPGLPIQPVIVRYPHVHFDQSWGNISLLKLMFRMFTQFHNFMEVEYLAVVDPPLNKPEKASQFAEKTSFAMANALNVAQTSHSYGDMLLLARASENKKGNLSAYLVEMAWVQNTFNISTLEVMEFLDKFLAMNPDINGHVEVNNFLSTLRLQPSPLTLKIFDFIDTEKKGTITFRQFLLGSAHILNHPSFHNICEVAFDKYSGKSIGHLSIQQLGDSVPASQGTYDDSVAKIVRSFNVDEDGMVNRNDFMTFMRKNPLLIALFSVHLKNGRSVHIA